MKKTKLKDCKPDYGDIARQMSGTICNRMMWPLSGYIPLVAIVVLGWLAVVQEAGAVPNAQLEPKGELPPKGLALVVVDPGHGGTNWGAMGPNGNLEKEITLEISKRVKQHLIRILGVQVVLTRHGDEFLSLEERVAIANTLGADVFLSIHCNSSPQPGPRGFETFILTPQAYQRPNLSKGGDTAASMSDHVAQPVGDIVADLQGIAAHAASATLADMIRYRFSEVLPWPDRGVRQAGFDVLIGAMMPAVVVEVGFLNHPADGLLLVHPEMQDKVARSVVAALMDFRRGGIDVD